MSFGAVRGGGISRKSPNLQLLNLGVTLKLTFEPNGTHHIALVRPSNAITRRVVDAGNMTDIRKVL